MRYGIWDPTGNVTGLVESPVEASEQPAAAELVMRRHPEVEQVGFVRLASDDSHQVELRMAGGEFCGNASMCAAAYYLATRDSRAAVSHAVAVSQGPAAPSVEDVRLRVSGARDFVDVQLRREDDGSFAARVHMPEPLGVEQFACSCEHVSDTLPVVRMEGISHIVIESSSRLFALRDDKATAERAVKVWCAELGADGLGLMFLEGEGALYRLDPLVYVPGSGTVFWERSCASGSSAVGMYMAARTDDRVLLELHEPGGILRVESDPLGDTWLQGSVRLVEYGLEL